MHKIGKRFCQVMFNLRQQGHVRLRQRHAAMPAHHAEHEKHVVVVYQFGARKIAATVRNQKVLIKRARRNIVIVEMFMAMHPLILWRCEGGAYAGVDGMK